MRKWCQCEAIRSIVCVGDYPFDGSMLAETVHGCTAGTPAGDALEQAYNGCGQGDFKWFLQAMGWPVVAELLNDFDFEQLF